MDVQRGRRRGEEGPGEGAGASGETEPHACHQLLCNAGVMQALNRLLISLLLALGANAPSRSVSECKTFVRVSRVHVDVLVDVRVTETARGYLQLQNSWTARTKLWRRCSPRQRRRQAAQEAPGSIGTGSGNARAGKQGRTSCF